VNRRLAGSDEPILLPVGDAIGHIDDFTR